MKAIRISVIVLLVAGFGLFAYSLGYTAAFSRRNALPQPTWPVEEQRAAWEQRWGPASQRVATQP